MITKEDFAKMLSGEQEIMRQQTDGLSHADSLLQPQPGGNCLNWVMGHLVGNLVEIQRVLCGDLPDGLPDLNHYGFGSDPVHGEEAGVIDFQALLGTYDLLMTHIGERLAEMSEADFEEEIDFWQGKTRRGYVAFFYFFHHTYHLGQLEQLRNLAGRTEKVI
jgi:hypothetical protein